MQLDAGLRSAEVFDPCRNSIISVAHPYVESLPFRGLEV
jgi:hypothetical protein